MFKYLNKEHAELFFDQGTIRLGTLYEYFAIDVLGEEVGDSREGMASVEIWKDQYDHVRNDRNNPSYLAQWARQMFLKSPEASLVESFAPYYMTIDRNIYCVSRVFSESLAKQFGYNACFQINDLKRFLDITSEALEGQVTPEGSFLCEYIGRHFDYDNAPHISPILLKAPKYSHQQEVRMIWTPNYPEPLENYDWDLKPAPPASAILLDCHELTKVCSPKKV